MTTLHRLLKKRLALSPPISPPRSKDLGKPASKRPREIGLHPAFETDSTDERAQTAWLKSTLYARSGLEPAITLVFTDDHGVPRCTTLLTWAFNLGQRLMQSAGTAVKSCLNSWIRPIPQEKNCSPTVSSKYIYPGSPRPFNKMVDLVL